MKSNKNNAKIIFSLFFLGVYGMTGCKSVSKDISVNKKTETPGLENTEKIFLQVNDHLNGMFITMTDKSNPVLLFISGGPGVPEVWLNEAYKEKYPNRTSEHFTVCYWDYLGEGLSYNSKIKPEEITIEKLSEDAHAVAQYLKETFGKEKVYLMAHSSGTNLGLHLAQTNSEDFYCYFGMGQDYSFEKRYESGYYFMKEEFEKSGNKKALKKMNKLVRIKDDGKFIIKKPSTIGRDWENILLMAGCGTTREMRSDAKDIFAKQMSCKCYTFSEKINYWKGKMLLGKSPYRTYSVNPDLEALIPVHFFSGFYDYTTPLPLSRELYEKLVAPEKTFYTFSSSAHSPLWEENEKVIEAMLEHVR